MINASSHRFCLTTLAFLVGASFCLAADTNAPVMPVGPVPAPSMTLSLLRVVGALAVVLGIFFGGVWLFRNWQRMLIQKGTAPKLNILEVRSLGARQAIYVVGYEQQRMLLASSPAGITFLTHLPNSETPASEAPPPAASFADSLRQALGQKS